MASIVNWTRATYAALLHAGAMSLRMKTILLVDDDQQVREVFGLALRRSGYYVIEAHSGVSGIEMARQYLPDLILSDILMPEGDGTTLLRDIRRDPELKFTQVVLMTGSSDLVTPCKGVEEWVADDFLVKPVGLQALLSCVQARVRSASSSWRGADQRTKYPTRTQLLDAR
jgi:DNA-binding response OmpR family regulator